MIDRLLFPETFADVGNPAIVMKVNLPVQCQFHTDIPRLGRVFVCVFVLLQDPPTSVSD